MKSRRRRVNAPLDDRLTAQTARTVWVVVFHLTSSLRVCQKRCGHLDFGYSTAVRQQAIHWLGWSLFDWLFLRPGTTGLCGCFLVINNLGRT
ncbi:hypothetical protein KFU94_36195 [Chloroflexi bacterium TSY]|nr:hypothetical protein [Chloroflexi bacterium TSY]